MPDDQLPTLEGAFEEQAIQSLRTMLRLSPVSIVTLHEQMLSLRDRHNLAPELRDIAAKWVTRIEQVLVNEQEKPDVRTDA